MDYSLVPKANMAFEIVDPSEEALGIRSYLSPGPGFLAVSKARYSDFLVREINLLGEVARLTDLSDSTLRNTTVKESICSASPSNASSGVVETDNISQNETKESSSRIKRKYEELEDQHASSSRIGEQITSELDNLLRRTCTWSVANNTGEQKAGGMDEQIGEILQFVQSAEGDPGKKYLQIPLISSATKEDRKTWHTLFHSFPLSKYVVTDTHKQQSSDGDNSGSGSSEQYIIRLWHKDFEQEMPNFGKFDRNNSRWRKGNRDAPKPPRDMPYLQFVLYKENMETAIALQQLQRRFGNIRGGGRGVRGGRGRYISNCRLRIGHAGMKDKRGVTCQFVTVPSSTSISGLIGLNQPNPFSQSLSKGGGGHTKAGGVALLRVGNFAFVQEELRLGRLSGNRFDVVLRHMQLGAGEGKGNHGSKLQKDLLKKSALNSANGFVKFGFVNYFGTQRFGKYHDTHLVGIAVVQGNFQLAVDIILRPKNDSGERENIRNARLAWQSRFDGVSDENERMKAEQKAAERFLQECGRFLNNEKAVCQSLARNPLDYERAFSCINKTMRMMFLHAFQSLVWNHLATYRIEKMLREDGRCGVVVGDLVSVNEQRGSSANQTSTEFPLREVHVATSDDVEQGKFELKDVVLPLIGRETSIPSYCEKVQDELLSTHGLKLESIQEFSDRDFSCPGDYRKVICQPKDVEFELIEYTDPLEPLVETDLMKQNGIQIRDFSETTHSDHPLLGMRIGFTLPSSAYATIALRELMKRPTSSEFQSGLKLEMTDAEPEEADDKMEPDV